MPAFEGLLRNFEIPVILRSSKNLTFLVRRESENIKTYRNPACTKTVFRTPAEA